MSVKRTDDGEKKKYIYVCIKTSMLTRNNKRVEQNKTTSIRRRGKKHNVRIKSLDLMEKVNRKKMDFVVVDMWIVGYQRVDDDRYQID